MNDEEPYWYGGKFGWMYQNSKHFNDKDFLGENYLYYKIIKIKIWSGKIDSKDVINGIQVFYKNILDGKIITPGEYKGDEGLNFVDEFEIKSNEYLINFHIRVGDYYVTQVGFETNKGNKILVGGTIGEDKPILSNGGDNIIVFLYGAYNNCLHSLGVGYINKKDYLKKFYIGYFELKFKLKNNEKFRNTIENNYKNLKEEDKYLFKACLLPEVAFNFIIKFLMF